MTSPSGNLVRVAWACLAAAGFAVLCYVMVDWARPDEGVVSVGFAMVLPAAICAFIAFVGDPAGRRRLGYYLAVPAASAVGMIVIATFVLREGAICIAMLSPLWIASGMMGSWGVYYTHRKRRAGGEDFGDTFKAHGLLLLPLMVMALETALPVPVAHYTVIRDVVIDADAETIWPLMRGMGEVPPDEGRWTISQSLLGLPRPQRAVLHGSGPGAIRVGEWQHGVLFGEVVTHWQPGRAIGWRFDFGESRGWDMTDPHLRPDGPNMAIRSGGYRLDLLSDGRHRLTLTTHYTAHMHFNGYAALWGELFLGDVQDNVLAIIRDRAEAAQRTR